MGQLNEICSFQKQWSSFMNFGNQYNIGTVIHQIMEILQALLFCYVWAYV